MSLRAEVVGDPVISKTTGRTPPRLLCSRRETSL